MTQLFKGDALELQFETAGKSAFDAVQLAKKNYFDGAYSSQDFLLMLYDSGRVPFSNRVPRAAFATFIQQALQEFRVTGTFESYIFMIKALFGDSATLLFTVPANGKLTVTVNAPGSSLDFFFQVKEQILGATVFSTIQTAAGEDLFLRGISGIESEAQLQVLFGELMPMGVYTTISLTFFILSQFVANYAGDGVLYTMLDNLSNEIVFYEP